MNDSEPTTTVTWTHRSNKRGIAEVDLKTGKVLSNMTLEEPTTTDSGIELTNKKLWALCAEYQQTILKLEEQVGREIRVRNNVIAELEVERDDLKESLRTTRLEQAAKAFQVDELETKVERLTAELAAIESRPE